MAKFRISDPAKADIGTILRKSERLHGGEARIRYRGLLTAAFRFIAAESEGVLTVDRGLLLPGLRSLHLRHCRSRSLEAPVAEPVHIVYFRIAAPGIVEIVRVIHERMDPGRHFGVDGRPPG